MGDKMPPGQATPAARGRWVTECLPKRRIEFLTLSAIYYYKVTVN